MKLILCGTGSLMRAPLSPLPGSRIRKLLNLRELTVYGQISMVQRLCCSPVHPGIQYPVLDLTFHIPHVSSLCGVRSLGAKRKVPSAHAASAPSSSRRCGHWTSLSRWLELVSSTCAGPLSGAHLCCCCKASLGRRRGRRAALCKRCRQSEDTQVEVLLACICYMHNAYKVRCDVRKGEWARAQGLTVCACAHAKSLQWCPSLCDPLDCGPPGSSAHGILQARILQWVAMTSSRGSSQPKD